MQEHTEDVNPYSHDFLDVGFQDKELDLSSNQDSLDINQTHQLNLKGSNFEDAITNLGEIDNQELHDDNLITSNPFSGVKSIFDNHISFEQDAHDSGNPKNVHDSETLQSEIINAFDNDITKVSRDSDGVKQRVLERIGSPYEDFIDDMHSEIYDTLSGGSASRVYQPFDFDRFMEEGKRRFAIEEIDRQFVIQPDPPAFHVNPLPEELKLSEEAKIKMNEYHNIPWNERPEEDKILSELGIYGISGIEPIGINDNGVPVYARMPLPSQVDGEFIAPRIVPGQGWIYVKFPASGEERIEFLSNLEKQMNEENRMWKCVEDFKRDSLKRQADIIEEMRIDNEFHDKIREIQQENYEREIANIRNETIEQYKTSQDLNLTKVDPNSHSDIYRDENGDLYEIKANGDVYKFD